jgi:ribosomal protein S18 acetylase RimI-like enzyme
VNLASGRNRGENPARMSEFAVEVLAVRDADDWAAAAQIVAEYVGSLGVDLAFQAIDGELAHLPQHYAPPDGVMLLAWVDGALAGCGALRPLPEADYPNACEMRRLYVRRAFRRFGLGRLLAQALIDHGLRAGYSCMLLDTLDDMEAARGLYDSLGFEEIPPFYFNPLPGAHYLKVELR